MDGNNMQQAPQAPYNNPNYNVGRRLLKTDRSLLMFIILSIVTCGIYAIVFWSSIGDDINLMATRRDGQKTTHFCLVYFLLGPITCNIYTFIWWHKLSQRIGDEARARGVATDLSASSFWLWYILGSLIIVGPFIYVNKLCKAMNGECQSFNQFGA